MDEQDAKPDEKPEEKKEQPNRRISAGLRPQVRQADLLANLRKDDDDHDGEPVDDEKWLISYADMITLLFGLFVMLYAMAIDKKGDMEAAVSALTGRPPKQGIPSAPGPITGRQGGAADLSMIEELKSLRDQQVKLRGDIDARDAEIRDLKSSLAKIPAAALKPGIVDSMDSAKRKLAMATQREKQNLTELEKATGEKAQLSSELADREQAINGLKVQLASLSDQNEKLQSKIDRELGSFMMIVLKWSTEKHDLDLRVKEPGGVSFDYTHRKHPNSKGVFLVDTRTGPGVELWQTPKLVPGTYDVTVAFYSDYGNTAPAEYEALIVTKKGVFPLPKAKMDIKRNQRHIQVTADADGEVTLN